MEIGILGIGMLQVLRTGRAVEMKEAAATELQRSTVQVVQPRSESPQLMAALQTHRIAKG